MKLSRRSFMKANAVAAAAAAAPKKVFRFAQHFQQKRYLRAIL
ncbi:twin-arginine translocation signal domain-containing protein [Escherichia coli]|nr:twin-arginine translocation signal domain-containing protein [Escherichia coli]